MRDEVNSWEGLSPSAGQKQNKTETHPLKEGYFSGVGVVKQENVSPFGGCSQGGGVGGVPLQTGDPAVKRAAGAVEVIGGQRADEGLLEALQETGTCSPTPIWSVISLEITCELNRSNPGIPQYKMSQV